MPSGTPLLFVHDDGDIADAALPSTRPLHLVAFDTDAHLSLAQRGIAHRTPWDYLARDELPHLTRLRDSVLDHWRRCGRLDYRGFNLLGMAAYRHVSCFARLTWALYAARRAIQALHPGRVLVFDEPACHGLDQPPLPRRMPMLSRVAAAAAEEAQLATERIARSPAARFEDQVALRDLGGGRDRAADVAGALGGRPYVLFYGNGPELARQLPLAREIRRQLGWRVVQLYKSASDEQVRAARAQGDLVWCESEAIPPRPLPDLAQRAAAASQAFRAAAAAAPAEARPLLASPALACHYDFLFGPYARKMAWHVEAWTDWLERHRPEALCVSYQTPLLDVAAALGIPCLALPHGLLVQGQPEQFTSLPPKVHVGALHAAHRRILLAHGLTAERVHVTGDPWADRLREQADAAPPEAAALPQAARSALERLHAARNAGERVILLCTGSYGMPASNVHLPMTDWRDAVVRTRRLGELLAARDHWRIVVKTHPRFDYPRLYGAISAGLPAARRWIVTCEAPLHALVAAADVVCVWNVLTSAIVEASLAGKPVICANPSVVWARETDWGTADWPHAADEDELVRTVERLLADPSAYASAVEATCAARRAFLDDPRGTAVGRCAAWIRQQAAAAR